MYINTYSGKCEKYVFFYEQITSVKVWNMKIEDLTFENFNSSLKSNDIFDNHYRTFGDWLILFKNECKQNKLTTLMDSLELYNKIDCKQFLQAVLNQRKILWI